MHAGRLDRQIVIEQAALAADSFGEPIKTWSTLATVWAEVRPGRNEERFAIREGQTDYARAVTVFRIRHRTDVTELMRISYNGDAYDIESITEIGRREGLEIRAVAFVP